MLWYMLMSEELRVWEQRIGAWVAQCQGCHGIADWKTAVPEVYRVPKLGGQKANYIVAALKAYRSGERDFPTMRAVAQPLTDKEMGELANYYASAATQAAETK